MATPTPPVVQTFDWKEFALELTMLAASIAAGSFTGNIAAALRGIQALTATIEKAIQAQKQIVGQLIDENAIQPIEPIP